MVAKTFLAAAFYCASALAHLRSAKPGPHAIVPARASASTALFQNGQEISGRTPNRGGDGSQVFRPAIVLATANWEHGGPEAWWQLALSLFSFELEGWDLFVHKAPSDHFVSLYPEVRQIRIWDHKRPWMPGDIFIQPELLRCDEALIQKGVQVWVWLLEYIGPHVLQDVQKQMYSVSKDPLQHWGKCKLIGHTHFTTASYNAALTIRPYISQSILDNAMSHGLCLDGRFSHQFLEKKQNLVLIDESALSTDTWFSQKKQNHLLESFLPDLKSALQRYGAEVKVVNGYSRSQTLELFAKAKFVIHFCMRGAERMPIEASFHGAVFVTSACREGADHEDTPLPAKFVMKTPDVAGLVHLMKDAMSSNLSEHAQMVDAQIEYRRHYLSLGRKSMNKDVSTLLSVLRQHVPPRADAPTGFELLPSFLKVDPLGL